MSSSGSNSRRNSPNPTLRNSIAGAPPQSSGGSGYSFEDNPFSPSGLSSSSSGILPGGAAAKVFVGGLSWDTTNDGLRAYFSKYGTVIDAVIMRDRASGRSRGFGFVTFAEENAAEQVALETNHVLDNRAIEAKRAVSREEMAVRGSKTKKVFVGGLAMTVTEEDFRRHFERYGAVAESQIMFERDSGRPRGFGFVTFEHEDSVDRVLADHHELGGKVVEVKKAEPKRSFATSAPAVPNGPLRATGSSTMAVPTTPPLANPAAAAIAAATVAAAAVSANNPNSALFSPFLGNPMAYVNELERSLGYGVGGFATGLGLSGGIGQLSGVGSGTGNSESFYGSTGLGGLNPPMEEPFNYYPGSSSSSGMEFPNLGLDQNNYGLGLDFSGFGGSRNVGTIGSGKPGNNDPYGYFGSVGMSPGSGSGLNSRGGIIGSASSGSILGNYRESDRSGIGAGSTATGTGTGSNSGWGSPGALHYNNTGLQQNYSQPLRNSSSSIPDRTYHPYR